MRISVVLEGLNGDDSQWEGICIYASAERDEIKPGTESAVSTA